MVIQKTAEVFTFSLILRIILFFSLIFVSVSVSGMAKEFSTMKKLGRKNCFGKHDIGNKIKNEG